MSCISAYLHVCPLFNRISTYINSVTLQPIKFTTYNVQYIVFGHGRLITMAQTISEIRVIVHAQAFSSNYHLTFEPA